MQNAFSKVFIFAGLALSVMQTPRAQTSAMASGAKKITSVEGITEYDLPNGLKVLIFPDMSQPTITVNVTYLVGSRLEGYGETGMAHLLEHMAFKGTALRPDVSKELNDHGCQFNGSTSEDRTNYFETFTATDENLNWALAMEAARMVNSRVSKKDLSSEMTVVRNEFEIGENNPTAILYERMLSSAYLWHNYGKTTIGNRSDIENVPIENLQAFYKKYYQPDNSVLLVAGKIDAAKTLALVEKYFSKIPKPDRVLQTSYTVEPTQDGERAVALRRVGDVQIIAAMYHIPAGMHPDYPAMEIVDEILQNNPSGRAYKALVQTKKASRVFAWETQLKDPGIFIVGAEVRTGQSLEEAKTALTNTLDSMGVVPPSKDEVERAKAKILKNVEELYRNSGQVGVTMSEYIAMGDWRLFYLYRDGVKKTTAEDVYRAARTYLVASNRTIGTFIPDAKPIRAEIPAAPAVVGLVQNYKGEAAIATGEIFDPSPKNIESRTHKGQTPVGIKYAFLPKTTRGGSVSADLTLRFGDEQSLKGQRLNSLFAAQTLMKGTKTKTEQQIKDALDQLKASVRIFGGGGSTTVTIQTIKGNLPAVLQLVNEVLTQAVIPEKEFDQFRQQQLAGLEQQKSDPQGIATREFRRILNPYPKDDPRYTAAFDEAIEGVKALKVEDARKFYHEFYGASNATLSVVGDFDENAVKKVMEDGLGSFKSPKPYKRIENKYMDVAKSDKTVKTPDKANAMFMAGQHIKINDAAPDYPALFMGNWILGGGELSSRLADRIRKKDGLSYGVGSFLDVPSQDDNATFGSYAMYAPQNADKLLAAFKEEVDLVQKDGVTEKELADAKKALLQQLQLGRSQDPDLAGELNNYLFINRDILWDAAYEDKINKLTVSDVNNALKKYIDPNKITIIKAGDFDKVVKP